MRKTRALLGYIVLYMVSFTLLGLSLYNIAEYYGSRAGFTILSQGPFYYDFELSKKYIGLQNLFYNESDSNYSELKYWRIEAEQYGIVKDNIIKFPVIKIISRDGKAYLSLYANPKSLYSIFNEKLLFHIFVRSQTSRELNKTIKARMRLLYTFVPDNISSDRTGSPYLYSYDYKTRSYIKINSILPLAYNNVSTDYYLVPLNKCNELLLRIVEEGIREDHILDVKAYLLDVKKNNSSILVVDKENIYIVNTSRLISPTGVSYQYINNNLVFKVMFLGRHYISLRPGDSLFVSFSNLKEKPGLLLLRVRSHTRSVVEISAISSDGEKIIGVIKPRSEWYFQAIELNNTLLFNPGHLLLKITSKGFADIDYIALVEEESIEKISRNKLKPLSFEKAVLVNNGNEVIDVTNMLGREEIVLKNNTYLDLSFKHNGVNKTGACYALVEVKGYYRLAKNPIAIYSTEWINLSDSNWHELVLSAIIPNNITSLKIILEFNGPETGFTAYVAFFDYLVLHEFDGVTVFVKHEGGVDKYLWVINHCFIGIDGVWGSDYSDFPYEYRVYLRIGCFKEVWVMSCFNGVCTTPVHPQKPMYRISESSIDITTNASRNRFKPLISTFLSDVLYVNDKDQEIINAKTKECTSIIELEMLTDIAIEDYGLASSESIFQISSINYESKTRCIHAKALIQNGDERIAPIGISEMKIFSSRPLCKGDKEWPRTLTEAHLKLKFYESSGISSIELNNRGSTVSELYYATTVEIAFDTIGDNCQVVNIIYDGNVKDFLSSPVDITIHS